MAIDRNKLGRARFDIEQFKTTKDIVKHINNLYEEELAKIAMRYATELFNVVMHPTHDLSAKRRTIKKMNKKLVADVHGLEQKRDYTLEGATRDENEQPF